jgi:AraC-like DNA-binding protein
MDLSVRTLQRRLVECSTGFRRLLGATRMEEALPLLANPRLPLAIVADQLAYSDASALSHAVRTYLGAHHGICEKRCELRTIRCMSIDSCGNI